MTDTAEKESKSKGISMEAKYLRERAGECKREINKEVNQREKKGRGRQGSKGQGRGQGRGGEGQTVKNTSSRSPLHALYWHGFDKGISLYIFAESKEGVP